MSDWVAIPLSTQAYQSQSLPASAQELVNMYPEPLPDGANGSMVLLPTPGLVSWSEVGDGPIRGLHAMGGYLYAVSGTELYRIAPNGSVVQITGTIEGAQSVHMTDNGVHVGIASDKAFYAANATGITEVVAEGFNGATYQDGYGILSKRGTEQFFLTGLDDMTSVNALDFSTADVFADTLMGCISDHRELWLFGKDTSEIWYNSGNATFPFQRVPSGFLELGCLAGGSIAKTNHHVVWLGSDYSVHQSVGYQPQKISTPAIDLLIKNAGNQADSTGYTYTQLGHIFYVLHVGDLTVAYDFTTQRWHTRQTHGRDRWAGGPHALLGGVEYFGDYETGDIYKLTPGAYADDGDEQLRVVTSGTVGGGGYAATMDELELVIEAGVGQSDGPPDDDPQISVECSDDGGRTWSTPRLAPLGKVGEYARLCRWTRLGRFRERILRFTLRADVKLATTGCRARMSGNR